MFDVTLTFTGARIMKKSISLLLIAVFIIISGIGDTASAARRPDIISYDAELLQDAITVHIKWQSEYPVVKAAVSAGNERQEMELDPYDDNIKDAYGYHGETSVLVKIDSSGFLDEEIAYVVQITDDVGKRSRRISGTLKIATTGGTSDQTDDSLSDQYVAPSPDGKSPSMIDKVIKVMERHDTPPVVSEIRVNFIGDKTVNFFSSAIDDKGLRDVKIRIVDDKGSTVGEKVFSDLGKTWQGTTASFKLAPGDYTVVAQATDSAGNRSPEKRKNFSTKAGKIPDRTPPVTVISPAGGTYKTPQNLTLTCTDAGGSGCKATYYTTDGTAPTIKSPLYRGPFAVFKTTTVKFFSTDKAGNSETAKKENYTIQPPPPKPPVVIPEGKCQIKITDDIKGHHGPKGVFFKKTAKLMVPDLYSRIIVAADAEGSKPWGADDWANFTVTSPTGAKQTASLGKNDAWGKPIGEQYILSNIIKLQPGLNTIHVDLWNEFAPAGSNQGSSAMWLVVQCPAGQGCQNGLCVPTVQPPPPPPPPKDTIPPVTQASPKGSTYVKTPVVTLICTDTGDSGCKDTYYTTDGKAPTTNSPIYRGPFTVSESTTVKFFSTDKAGNREAFKTERYVIQPPAPKDTVPPVTKAAPAGKTFTNQVRVTLVCKDNTGGSGCKATHYTTDGTAPTINSPIYRGPLAVSKTTTVKFFSIDKAGNSEKVSSVLYTIKPVHQEKATLRIDKTVFLAGEPIRVKFKTPKGYDQKAWVGIIPSNIPHGSEKVNDANDLTYKYLNNKISGILDFVAPRKPGEYDFRMNDSDTDGNEVASVSFIVERGEGTLHLLKREYELREKFVVEFTASPYWPKDAWIGLIPALVPHGSEKVNDERDLAYKYLDGRARGSITFSTPTEPGNYDLRMFDRDNGSEITSVSFKAIIPKGTLRLDGQTFAPGTEIAVHFTASPNLPDKAWVGIIPSNIPHGSEKVNDANDLAYQYLAGKTKGTLIFRAPKTTGTYDFRMHNSDNNGYEIASVSFTITNTIPSPVTKPPGQAKDKRKPVVRIVNLPSTPADYYKWSTAQQCQYFREKYAKFQWYFDAKDDTGLDRYEIYHARKIVKKGTIGGNRTFEQIIDFTCPNMIRIVVYDITGKEGYAATMISTNK